jgi:hypothetical protein
VTADIVLWLDLAEANQQGEATVREAVPPGAEILRLTEQGVEASPEGTPQRWGPVLDGIDRLVRQARRRERQLAGCRYWVTGRAGLPAFFHLGHRLGKMAAATFVHQPRNGGKAVLLPLDPLPSAADTGRRILGDLATVCGAASSAELLARAQSVGLPQYLALTRELIECAVWLRRFTQIELGS